MYDIRPLEASDWDDILEIAKNTWSGHDYLPSAFKSWISDPASHTACIELDNHVIALANLRIIENGRTGWMEGLRVHPDYRGKRLASLLTDHVVEKARSLGVERLRYTTATVNTESLHLGMKIGMERRFDLGVYWHGRPADIRWFHSSGPKIVEITPDELHPLAEESGLIPHNIIVYDWKAVDATIQGLRGLAEFSTLRVQVSDETLESLSIGYPHETRHGLEWALTIYARSTTGFLDQLSQNIALATELDCYGMFMAFPQQFLDNLWSLSWVRRDEDEDIGLTLLERVL